MGNTTKPFLNLFSISTSCWNTHGCCPRFHLLYQCNLSITWQWESLHAGYRVKDTLPRVKVTQLPFNHAAILLSSFLSRLCLPLSSISHSAESAVGPCTCPLLFSLTHPRELLMPWEVVCSLFILQSHTLTHSCVYRECQVCYACPATHLLQNLYNFNFLWGLNKLIYRNTRATIFFFFRHSHVLWFVACIKWQPRETQVLHYLHLLQTSIYVKTQSVSCNWNGHILWLYP